MSGQVGLFVLAISLFLSGCGPASQGVLAEAVPTVENGLWRLFPDGRMETVWKIRSNVFWHDGTPFTAEDLVFTARVDQDPGLTGSIGVVWSFIEGMEAAEVRTLVVRWKQPYVQADSMFDAPLPKHLLADPSIHRDFEAELVKNGVQCRMGNIHPFCTQRKA